MSTNFENNCFWDGVAQTTPSLLTSLCSEECWRFSLLSGARPGHGYLMPSSPLFRPVAHTPRLWSPAVYVLSARIWRHWKRADARLGLLAPIFFLLKTLFLLSFQLALLCMPPGTFWICDLLLNCGSVILGLGWGSLPFSITHRLSLLESWGLGVSSLLAQV